MLSPKSTVRRVGIGTCLAVFSSFLLIPQRSLAFTLPSVASPVPPAAWTEKPYINGQETLLDEYGRVRAVFICVSFSNLPKGYDTVCGYADVTPLPAPPNVTPPPGSAWTCIPGVNVLIYSEPFNRGQCFFASTTNPPANAFQPTSSQIAAGAQDALDLISYASGLPPITVPPVPVSNSGSGTVLTGGVSVTVTPSKHFTPEQKAALNEAAESTAKTSEILGSFIPFSVQDFTKAKYTDLGNLFLDKAIKSIFEDELAGKTVSKKFKVGELGTIAGTLETTATIVAIASIPVAEVGEPAAALLETVAKTTETVGTGLGLGSLGLKFLSLDPPDPNFTQIALPSILPLPSYTFTTADSTSQSFTDKTNALIANLFRSISVEDALLTSLNRADGAASEGNDYWEQQQLQAANSFSLQLGDLIGEQPQLFADLSAAYKSIPGFPNKDVTVDNVIAAQNSLLANGFSPELLQLFDALGVDAASQEQIKGNLLALDPNQILALGDNFPESLTDPTFTASLEGASQALKQGVISGNSQGVPEPSEVAGSVLSIGLLALGWRFKRK